jgi:serine/threonine-protein kinase RIM15
MWMIKPYVVREVTIDLPDVLVESLGVGAEILARFLTTLAEEGVTDPNTYPKPPPVLCRLCERHILFWWFEKHTELCLQEHTAESDAQYAQETLTDHRRAIVKVLDAFDAQIRQPRATSIEAPPAAPIAEYNGLPIGSSSTPPTLSSSGRSSPASPPSRSLERPSSGFGHGRAKSFAVRRPIPRIVELLLDLCDTAIEINMPVVKESLTQPDGEIRSQSPQSESRISQVQQWQSPSTSTVEQEQGLAALCDDTAKYAKAKVDAIVRYRAILEYSERIRVEFEILVQECIEAAIEKTARIAAGDLSDSTEDLESLPLEEAVPAEPTDDMFPCSLEAPSSMAEALKLAAHRSSAIFSDPTPSTASTRSNSPKGARTPRSRLSGLPLTKRASMHLDSDTGADSDGSIPSLALTSTRAESPVSDFSLSRVTSTRDRKRHSLILPSSKANRQQSPARSMPPPSSPLRMTKARVTSAESTQSPVTSPVLVSHEFSSPALPQHVAQFHRRQSSTPSSDHPRAQSPRPQPMSSNPQPRAAPPSIKDFEVIKPISKGAFGSVFLAKKKSTADYYAIKVLKKADMVAKNQITNVKAERAIMMWQGESDFVAKLYWTFANKDYLFLVMEYLNGGDCASLIKALGGLPEDWSKRYLAEVVLGVEHLHSRGIIHRDLKPDNLLIDYQGHLKLTDFGLSRMGLVGRQKRALNPSSDEPPVPDLLKQNPFQRTVSVGSSRSASFDFQGGSPSQTPSMTPSVLDSQPSYFSLVRESLRRESNTRSDSENSEALQVMFRRMSLADDLAIGSQSSIDEESSGESPDMLSLPVSANSALPTPAASTLLPSLALFDPEENTGKFVGTPDYLAPETINGVGQDELSDWWSLGCILFEFLYGYPPFNAETPDQVFQNILGRKIQWQDDPCEVSPEAKDLMNKLMCTEPKERLGANAEGTFATGAEEIKNHLWFAEINWETLREDEASFVPAPENPEDTEYFDHRGATLQTFTDFDDHERSPIGPASGDYPERPHDALSKVRSQVQISSSKRGLIPLHIPPHVRDGRSRRLSEPVPTDDFGNFAFKNIPALEKANKDVIQKLKAEAMHAQSKPLPNMSPVVNSPAPSLESSPILPMPLKRALSANKGSNRPASPLLYTQQPTCSPSRVSQPSSPLLVQFSTGYHERRKTSSSSSSLSMQTSGSLQPGSFFDLPRLPGSMKTSSSASSPIKHAKPPGGPLTGERAASISRQLTSNPGASPRGRSATLSSQESEDVIKDIPKRRSQVFDGSPSSSDNEDTRQKALLRVQRRRQSSHRLSQITLAEGPVYRPLDVLVCEDHPVSRLVMEKLLERLRCRTVTATSGTDASRYAMGEVKFDIIFTEYRLPHLNGADFARMVRKTKNVNTATPIVAVTQYLNELPPAHFFDAMVVKPPTAQKLGEAMGRLCQWRPPPPPVAGVPAPALPLLIPAPAQNVPWANPSALLAHLRSTSGAAPSASGDSPTSFSSGLFGGTTLPSGSYRGSSREDSISSSFFGDTESRASDGTTTMRPPVLSPPLDDHWTERDLLARSFEGLGISEAVADDHPSTAKTTTDPPAPFPGSLASAADINATSLPASAAVPTLIPMPLPRPGAMAPALHIRTGASGTQPPQRKRRSGEQQSRRRGIILGGSGSTLASIVGGASGGGPGAESGDDEDEELGMSAAHHHHHHGHHHHHHHHGPGGSSSSGSIVSIGSSGSSSAGGGAASAAGGRRGKSPRGSRARGSSKLGTEMLRTNSRGSVVSVDGGEPAVLAPQTPGGGPVTPTSSGGVLPVGASPGHAVVQSPVEPVIREGVAEDGVPDAVETSPFIEAERRAEAKTEAEAETKTEAVAKAATVEVPGPVAALAQLAPLEKAATT